MLQVFKPLPIAREVHRMDALPAGAAGFQRDTLTLGWEERVRIRGRRRSDAGAEFGMALPRGTVLRDGECVIVADLSLVVAIVERPEPVFVIAPASPAEWAAFGYHIGNSHQPLMIGDGVLVCPDVPGMEQVLCYHGIPFTRDRRAFTPVGMGSDVYVAGHQHAPAGVAHGSKP
jgi:urease accessory protein